MPLNIKNAMVEKLIEELADMTGETKTEAAIVVSARLRRDARSLLARFLVQGAITAIPFGEEHYGTAWMPGYALEKAGTKPR